MKVAILFPGYGTQFVGMGKNLYDDERLMQEYFEEANACLNSNFVKLCFASSESELAKLHNAYQSLFVLGYSIYGLLKTEEIVPTILGGENIGEITAISCAGGITFPDSLYLLTKYAQFYQEFIEQNKLGMIAVKGLDERKLSALCESKASDLAVAIHRPNGEFVVSGYSSSIDILKKELDDYYNVTYKDEDVGHELHSDLMSGVLNAFKPYLTKVDFRELSTPVLNTMDGTLIRTAHQVQEAIVNRITRPIFTSKLYAAMDDYDLIVQAGPGNSIVQMVKSIFPQKMVVAVNQRSDINEIKKFIEMYPLIKSQL